MRSHIELRALAVLGAAVAGCVADAVEDVEPPLNRMFRSEGMYDYKRDAAGNIVLDGSGNPIVEVTMPPEWIEDPVAHALAGGKLFFDDRTCWIPDADSFDSYENPELGIGPGTTPVAGNCAADGKATGPIQFNASHKAEDLLPSKWCKTDRPCAP